jgi:lipopolysaccharide/colanic/teichoic acid biosynthesis glycosyltransferase
VDNYYAASADAQAASRESSAPGARQGRSADASPSRGLRAIEVLVASLVLLLCAPVILVIAIIIKLDSPGPAFFVQRRLGRGALPFRFVKFRTFHADARERFPELYTYRYSSDELNDLRFKVDNDPRVTRVGAWLRQSTLDELPNFWNVLTGEVALVGPRPEIPEMLPYYQGDMMSKFSVRPGITGLAQISGRGRLRFYETVNHDLEYVRRRSLKLDLSILLRTIAMVIRRDGAF